MTKSESIAQLAEALSKAQNEMEGAKKDASNPFFKSTYADLASVWDACRGPLGKYGLSVSQMPESNDGKITVHTILMHASGEWIASELSMTPVKNDPQGMGSAITYARRYALSAAVGIAPFDDDGNAASLKPGQERSAKDVKIEQPRPAKNSAAAHVRGTGGIQETPELPSSAADNLGPLADALVKKVSPDETIDVPRQKRLHIAFKEAIPEKVAESTRKNADVIFREWLRHEGFTGSDGLGSTKGVPVLLFDEVLQKAENYASTLR